MLGRSRRREFARQRFTYALADVSRRTLTRAFTLFSALSVLGMGWSQAAAQHPDPDRRILQISSRLYNGFGFAHGLQHQGLMGDTGIRTDFLWGDPGDEHVRFGPQIDVRSACDLPIFVTCLHNKSIEFSAGPSLLIPFRRGYPMQISPTVGYAFRRDDYGGNGMFLSNTFAWGYRPYNYFHRYGYGIMAFVSHRLHLNDVSQWEMTFGIEFDMELAVWTPILIVRMMFQNDDPDEPDDEADPTVRDVGGASTGAQTPAPSPAVSAPAAPAADAPTAVAPASP